MMVIKKKKLDENIIKIPYWNLVKQIYLYIFWDRIRATHSLQAIDRIHTLDKKNINLAMDHVQIDQQKTLTRCRSQNITQNQKQIILINNKIFLSKGRSAAPILE